MQHLDAASFDPAQLRFFPERINPVQDQDEMTCTRLVLPGLFTLMLLAASSL